MSITANLAMDETIEEEKDTLGGGSKVLDSGLYRMNIDTAYLDTSKGGALGLYLTFKGDSGEILDQTLWMTSGTAKGTKNFYVTKDGKKRYLPGFLQADSLAMLTTGKHIAEITTDDLLEEKVFNVYSPELKKQAPSKKQAVMELMGKKVILGIIKERVNKQVKDSSGNYVDSAEERFVNDINKVFNADSQLTSQEIQKGITEPVFIKSWDEKFTDTLKDKYNPVQGGQASNGLPTGNASPTPTKSLFK